jgi:cytochrome c oxidase subunit 4
MSNDTQIHIVKYKTYFYVLLALLTFTSISVAITRIDLGNLAIVGALILATLKASLVLWHFMHLKYESRVFMAMIGLVIFVFLSVMIITFLDYGFKHY